MIHGPRCLRCLASMIAAAVALASESPARGCCVGRGGGARGTQQRNGYHGWFAKERARKQP
eukprot:10448524-Alexandrium_andersonii.AAC.1